MSTNPVDYPIMLNEPFDSALVAKTIQLQLQSEAVLMNTTLPPLRVAGGTSQQLFMTDKFRQGMLLESQVGDIPKFLIPGAQAFDVPLEYRFAVTPVYDKQAREITAAGGINAPTIMANYIQDQTRLAGRQADYYQIAALSAVPIVGDIKAFHIPAAGTGLTFTKLTLAAAFLKRYGAITPASGIFMAYTERQQWDLMQEQRFTDLNFMTANGTDGPGRASPAALPLNVLNPYQMKGPLGIDYRVVGTDRDNEIIDLANGTTANLGLPKNTTTNIRTIFLWRTQAVQPVIGLYDLHTYSWRENIYSAWLYKTEMYRGVGIQQPIGVVKIDCFEDPLIWPAV